MAIGTFLILLETRNSMLPSMNYELNVQTNDINAKKD